MTCETDALTLLKTPTATGSNHRIKQAQWSMARTAHASCPHRKATPHPTPP
jgi:hypothetical protein